MNLGEVCNREVIVIYKTDTILNAAKIMRQYHVGDVVVVEDREAERVPIGILTDRDIVVEIIAAAIDPDTISVGDSMSYQLVTGREEDEILDTIKLMRSKGVRRLPVVNAHGGLVGILTMDNLIDLIAEQLTDITGLVANQQKFECRKCV